MRLLVKKIRVMHNYYFIIQIIYFSSLWSIISDPSIAFCSIVHLSPMHEIVCYWIPDI